MKKLLTVLFLVLVFAQIYSEEIVKLNDGRKVVLYDDHTWADIKNETSPNSLDLVENYKQQLRKGISASDSDIKIACEMLAQGWKYTMPRPKSAQAAWGNSDGRTTWYNGFWYNSISNLYSVVTPTRKDSGLYLGDNQNTSNSWRNGGSPRKPDIYMYLLSDSGGPRN
jgi:hypothetical protein